MQPCPNEASAPCPRVDNSHSGNFVSFGCTRGWREYNDLATLFFNTQDDAIRNLFSSQTKSEYTVSSLITFVVCFYFLAVITYGISCPVGLFVPGILCGAAYGRLVGIYVADIQRHKHIDEGTYALLGAASFLGGSMRLTMCMCVMLLELTNNLALLPLTMLVLLMAKFVGDGTGVKSIYEVLMDVKVMPYLPRQPEGFLRHVNVKECCSQPPVTFLRVEKVSNLVRALKQYNHNSFPVKEVGVGEIPRGPSHSEMNHSGGPSRGGVDPALNRDSHRPMSGDGGLETSLSLESSMELASRQHLQAPSLLIQPRRIAGMILRQHILVLLDAKRAMQPSPLVSADSLPVATSFDFYGDFAKPISTKGLTIEELESELGPYLNMYLDLGPYVDPSFYVVQEDASLSKVYKLFRTLGLRHLCVIPRANEVVGIITREDLLSENVGARFEGGSYRTDGMTMTISPTSPLIPRT
jgi:chloride channel 7